MKKWGLFDKDGKPIAPGDEWHKWECPSKQYQNVDIPDYETGEVYETRVESIPCPFEPIGIKLDRCTKCGMEFIYP